MSSQTVRCHCGAPATDNDYPRVCDQWPLCETRKASETLEDDPMALPCEACSADATEPCRPGCLGEALESGALDWSALGTSSARDCRICDGKGTRYLEGTGPVECSHVITVPGMVTA